MDDLAVGDVVCLDGGTTGVALVTKALPAALAALGAAYGVCTTTALKGNTVVVQTGGFLASSFTGLPAQAGNVRVSATGRCEFVAQYASGDYPMGTTDAGGILNIVPRQRVTVSGGIPDRATLQATQTPTNGTAVFVAEVSDPYIFDATDLGAGNGITRLKANDNTPGTWVLQSTLSIATVANASVALFQGGTPKIMLMGDSVTFGGSAGVSTDTGFRTDLYRLLRAKRQNFQFIGTMQDGRSGFFVLGDWHHEGHTGFRIEQLDVTTYFASAGKPDVLMLMIGTNNISNGQSGATCLGFLGTLLDTIKAQAPLAKVFVSSIPPWVSPAASFAAKEVEREAYNAGIAALCTARGSNFMFHDACGALTGAHIQNDGIHPNRAGYGMIARNYADTLHKVLGTPFGLYMPRGLSTRPKQASYSMSTTNTITIPYSVGLKPSASGPFSVGFWFRPSSLANGFFALVAYGTDYTRGYVLLLNIAAGVVQFSVYFRTSGPVTFFTPASVLFVNKWHQIFFAYDSAAAEARLHITPEGMVGHLAMAVTNPTILTTTSAQDPTVMGASNTFNAAPGLYDNLIVCSNYAVTPADVEAYYYEGILPPNVTAYYSISEGSGGTVANATGFTANNGTASGGSWVAAGTNPKPFDE